jgi:Arc/MetJ-type ribon-helix-helix transcriptional regulator
VKQIKVYLPEDIVSKLPLLLNARGFENLSPYVRELVENDLNNIGKSGISPVLRNVILDKFKQLENTIENNSTALLQRSYIQTQIIIEQLSRTCEKNIPALTRDDFQKLINEIIADSKTQHPFK